MTAVALNPITDTLAPSDGGPHGGQMTITPDQAARILADRNNRNRNIAASVVAKYARDMRSGNWLLNGDAIRFAVDGSLLDGQHRLAAIVKAGVPVRSFVVWNLPAESQATMDDGRKRTMANVLELDDIGGSHSKTAASILRRIILLDRGYTDGSGGGSAAPTKTEMREYLADNPDVIRAAEVADQIRSARGIRCAASTVGLAYLLCARKSQADADAFFDKLRTGAGLDEGHPVLVLRNKLATDGSTRLRTETGEALAWFIRAWNAYRAGKSIRILRQKTNDRFPVPS